MLTVVVPVGPGERVWNALLADLAVQLPTDAEVLVAATEPAPSEFEAAFHEVDVRHRWLVTRVGRAAQMNDAVRAARGEFVWFLHADSRLPRDAVPVLLDRLTAEPGGLHYFGLRFTDGPWLLRLNEIGVGFRCRVFRLPFGDQGFCIRREAFERLGGFDESAPYGEDHLLVWAAKRAGVPVRRLPAAIATSGRKYAERGWAKTTWRHVRLTVRQAWGELLRGFDGGRR